MSTVKVPFGRETDTNDLVPRDDELLLHPTELRVGMVVVAASYSHRKGQLFMRHYCPDEPYESTRSSEWCEIVRYEYIKYPNCDSLGSVIVKFVGKHRDGALVNYQFVLLSDTTNFIVKRDSIAG